MNDNEIIDLIFEDSKLNCNYIKDRNKNIRWIFPSTLKMPSFLNFYNSNTIKGILYKYFIYFVFKIRIQRFFISGNTNCKLKDKYFEILRKLNCINYSVFTGTAGENRKIVIELNDGKKTKYFIKIPTTKSSKRLISKEKNNLVFLEQFSFNYMTIPSVVSFNEEEIVITNIKPEIVAKGNGFSKTHLCVLEEIYDKTLNKVHISNLDSLKSAAMYVDNLNTAVINIDNSFHLKIKNLSENLNKLKKIIYNEENRLLSISFAHCDFTPWNMYLANNKIHVYDWELAKNEIPLFFDFIHYIFQENILIKHKNYKEIKLEISKYLKEDYFKGLLKKYSVDFNEYYTYYLFINCSYYALKYLKQKDLHVQAIWLVDVWNEAIEDVICPREKIFELI